jgi:hypothetical protein
VEKLHDHHACFDRLSMKSKSSWHRPKENLILSLSKDEAAAAAAGTTS